MKDYGLHKNRTEHTAHNVFRGVYFRSFTGQRGRARVSDEMRDRADDMWRKMLSAGLQRLLNCSRSPSSAEADETLVAFFLLAYRRDGYQTSPIYWEELVSEWHDRKDRLHAEYLKQELRYCRLAEPHANGDAVWYNYHILRNRPFFSKGVDVPKCYWAESDRLWEFMVDAGLRQLLDATDPPGKKYNEHLVKFILQLYERDGIQVEPGYWNRALNTWTLCVATGLEKTFDAPLPSDTSD